MRQNKRKLMHNDTPQPPLKSDKDLKPKLDTVYVLSDEKEGTKASVPAAPQQILLLDDDKELTQALKDFLCDEGYQVSCVANGVEGMKLMMVKDFDAIICDLLMPNLPGDMFYLAVSKLKPALAKRFIFISGHQANPKWESFIRNSKALVLWKPFPLHDLLTCLEVIMQKPKS